MKKIYSGLITILIFTFFSSCRNKTVALLSKKWDCVKAENLNPTSEFQNAQDSANTVQLQSLLESLNWTFKENREYTCAVGSKVTIKGTYELQDDQKTLVCTPSTQNSINRYRINSLSENDLVLTSADNNVPLTLYFKPH